MNYAAKETGSITDDMKSINKSASNTKNAFNQILSSAHELSEESINLDNEVKSFLSEIRSA